MTEASAPAARHSRRTKLARTALGVAVAALGLGVTVNAPSASASSGCAVTSNSAPIVGSWYAQVHFPAAPFYGKTEATMMTLTPGGGLIEANPINPSPAGNSGFWQQNSDCSISARVLLFNWDPIITGVKDITDVRLRFVMDDYNHFHSTVANATVSLFDPQSGQRLGDQIVIPDISQTTATRFSTWTVPSAFPAQP